MAGRTWTIAAPPEHVVRDADEDRRPGRGRVVERGEHVELLAAGGRYAMEPLSRVVGA